MSHRSTVHPMIGDTLTLEEWADMPEDDSGELVDGRLEAEEVPDYGHELIVTWLTHVLRSWLAGRGGFVGGSGAKFAVGPRRGRKPDVSVYLPGGARPPREGIVRVPPDIVVEVISRRAADSRRDRIDKSGDYAAFGVRWYWLVDPKARTVEILERIADGRYVERRRGSDDVVRDVPGCVGLVLDVPEMWRELDRLDPGRGGSEADE